MAFEPQMAQHARKHTRAICSLSRGLEGWGGGGGGGDRKGGHCSSISFEQASGATG